VSHVQQVGQHTAQLQRGRLANAELQHTVHQNLETESISHFCNFPGFTQSTVFRNFDAERIHCLGADQGARFLNGCYAFIRTQQMS